jgi:hypothetical protein
MIGLQVRDPDRIELRDRFGHGAGRDYRFAV